MLCEFASKWTDLCERSNSIQTSNRFFFPNYSFYFRLFFEFPNPPVPVDLTIREARGKQKPLDDINMSICGAGETHCSTLFLFCSFD